MSHARPQLDAHKNSGSIEVYTTAVYINGHMKETGKTSSGFLSKTLVLRHDSWHFTEIGAYLNDDLSSRVLLKCQ